MNQLSIKHRQLKIMPKKPIKKDVVCYWCEKTKGVATLKLVKSWSMSTGKEKKEEVFDRQFRINKKKGGEVLWILKKVRLWRTKGFQIIGNGDTFLCKECDKHRCQSKIGNQLSCGKLLSNTHQCRRCGQKHGEFYSDKPTYCKFCVDNNFINQPKQLSYF